MGDPNTLPVVSAKPVEAPAVTAAGGDPVGPLTSMKSAVLKVAVTRARLALRTVVVGLMTRATGTTSPMRRTVPTTGVAGMAVTLAMVCATATVVPETGPRMLVPVEVPLTVETMPYRPPDAAESFRETVWLAVDGLTGLLRIRRKTLPMTVSVPGTREMLVVGPLDGSAVPASKLICPMMLGAVPVWV